MHRDYEAECQKKAPEKTPWICSHPRQGESGNTGGGKVDRRGKECADHHENGPAAFHIVEVLDGRKTKSDGRSGEQSVALGIASADPGQQGQKEEKFYRFFRKTNA